MEVSTNENFQIPMTKAGELIQVDQTREPVCNISIDRKTPTKESEVTLDGASDLGDKDVDGKQTTFKETMEANENKNPLKESSASSVEYQPTPERVKKRIQLTTISSP